MAKKNKRRNRNPAKTPPATPQQPSGVQIKHAQVSFSGPIPPPAALEAYDKVHPGLANRIMQMAEGEAEHIRQMDTKKLDSDVRTRYVDRFIQFTGQLSALIIGLAAIGGGVYVALNGQPIVGGVIGTGGVVGLVTVFGDGSKAEPQE